MSQMTAKRLIIVLICLDVLLLGYILISRLQSYSEERQAVAVQEKIDTIQTLAKDTGYLDISGCRANPLVMKVRKGKTFTIINLDEKDHTITIEGARELVIPANSESDFTADFAGDVGLYGYTCDNMQGGTGVLSVVNE
jgi:plastocyanin